MVLYYLGLHPPSTPPMEPAAKRQTTESPISTATLEKYVQEKSARSEAPSTPPMEPAAKRQTTESPISTATLEKDVQEKSAI